MYMYMYNVNVLHTFVECRLQRCMLICLCVGLDFPTGCDAVAGTGTPIEKVVVNSFTVSEVLRLYLLGSTKDSINHVRGVFIH